MNHDVHELPPSHQLALDETPESERVKVVLVDRDNLPIAQGKAVMPLLLGVGVFWPCCPMPSGERLGAVKGFTLPSGETLRVKELVLCAGDPPHYDFWIEEP